MIYEFFVLAWCFPAEDLNMATGILFSFYGDLYYLNLLPTERKERSQKHRNKVRWRDAD